MSDYKIARAQSRTLFLTNQIAGSGRDYKMNVIMHECDRLFKEENDYEMIFWDLSTLLIHLINYQKMIGNLLLCNSMSGF
jgi:hypothetical protein